MLLLYRIAITLYWFLIVLLSPYNEKAKKFREGRKGWQRKLADDFQNVDSKIVWVHAASLGEFEQGRPIIEALKASRSDVKILLTFFSPSGYEVRMNYEYADWIHYLPIDTPKNAKQFIGDVNPTIAIFIKYEFWYYLLKELIQKETPVLMVSSIFRSNQLFFHWSGSFFKPVFKEINHFFVQDEESANLISSISEEVTVSGDTRFDRVIKIANESKSFEIVESFRENEKCFIVGSSWPSDMKVLTPFISNHLSEMKFIIAPHSIKEEEIKAIEDSFDSTARYSDPNDVSEKRVLIIDNIGMLSSLYKYGSYVFIGGGFRGALHNTLEAAVYGMPLFFGKHENNHKFKEAIELVEEGAGFELTTTKELEKLFEEVSGEALQEVSEKARSYVHSRQGATDLIMKRLQQLL